MRKSYQPIGDPLRAGVVQSITLLGSAFLAHPANAVLRRRLRVGDISSTDYYRQLLCFIYRLLVLLSYGAWGLELAPIAHLRSLTLKRSTLTSTRVKKLIAFCLHPQEGLTWPEFMAAVLAAPLFARQTLSDLADCQLTSADLLAVVGALPGFAAPVAESARCLDYQQVTVALLGELYETLLEMHPVVELDAGSFRLAIGVGGERKSSGSYYTPASLISCLLDSALDPALAEACASVDPRQALLTLKICDPACGYGPFLVAAAQRLASAFRKYSTAQAAQAAQADLTTIIVHCLYGVDRDPVALELCRLALWLESDHAISTLKVLSCHLRCGNSLLGAVTAASLTQDPLTPLETAKEEADGSCAAFLGEKQRNGTPPLTDVRRLAEQYQLFHWQLAFSEVFNLPGMGTQVANNQSMVAGFDVMLGNPPWERLKMHENEWFAVRCPEIARARTAAERQHLVNALTDSRAALFNPGLAAEYQLALCQLEAVGYFIRHSGRFPLCGHGDLNTYALFVETMCQLVNATGRVGCIVPSGIATEDTYKGFFQDLLKRNMLVSFYDFENRRSLFPGVQGNVRFCLLTLAPQAPACFKIAAQLSDPAQLSDAARHYTLTFESLRQINPNTLTCPTFSSARDAQLITAIYARLPVLIAEGAGEHNCWGISFQRMFDMTNSSRLFRVQEQLCCLNWRLEGNAFVSEGGQQTYLPLYEAKLIGQFNHRRATFADLTSEGRFKVHASARLASSAELARPAYTILPRYWIADSEVQRRLPAPKRLWMLGFRNAMSAMADARSLVATILPYAGVGNSLPLLCCRGDARQVCALLALLNSFMLDYILRQKSNQSNLNFYLLKQLPFPDPQCLHEPVTWLPQAPLAWYATRVLELSYTSWDLRTFAQDCGYAGPPFAWDEERRFQLRCELDAATFLLYGVQREDVTYILESFPIVRRRDERCYGDYRTRRVILACYDALKAGQSG